MSIWKTWHQSTLKSVVLWTVFPHLPTCALFHDSVNALDYATQNLSGVLFSALHKGVGHSTQSLGSTKKQYPGKYQSVGRQDVSMRRLPD